MSRRIGIGLVVVCFLAACGGSLLFTDAEDGGASELPHVPLPAALPAGALELAAAHGISGWYFQGYSDEVLAAVDVPTPSEVRPYSDFVSDAEHGNAKAVWRAACDTDAGWPSVVDPPGSRQVVYRGPNAPEKHQSLEVQSCGVESVLRFPPRPEPASEGEWRLLYDDRLRQSECVREAGYPVPEQPSFDGFVEDPAAWYPFDLVPSEIDTEDWNRLIVDCEM